MTNRPVLGVIALIVLALTSFSTCAADRHFPDIVYLPTNIAPVGFQPEGFTIGRGHTAYSGSTPTGAIYKMNLRTGQGKILVPPQDLGAEAVVALGMRVDKRTNYLFVAGGLTGKAFVYDADCGDLLAEYQLGVENESLINDLTITRDAVYFTDSFNPTFYRLPLSRKGRLPRSPFAAVGVPLSGDFENIPGDFGVNSNGIVATRNGKVLIIGNSNLGRLYRVDPNSGHADAMSPDVITFPDGLVLVNRTLYILSPILNQVQVVKLDKNLLTGKILGTIEDSSLDTPASGARFRNSLYVVNARFFLDFPPPPDTQYWISKLDRHDIQR